MSNKIGWCCNLSVLECLYATQEWKHAGFTSPATLSTLLRTIRDGTGMSYKRLELFTAVELSYPLHRADGLAPNENNWELIRVGKSEEKRD
jgi:hypothetical protein